MAKQTWQEMTTLEKIAAIKAVWEPGASASELARAIPGKPSRSAMVGFYDRHKAKMPDTPLRDPARPARPKTPYVKLVPTLWLRKGKISKCHAFAMPAPLPESRFLAMVDLQANDCRWPVSPSDVSPAEHRFCGCRARLGSRYCEYHYEKSIRRDARAMEKRAA